jgi:hypothetical protein
VRRESFTASGPVELVVRVPSGSVEIESADTSEVEVTVEPLNDAARKAIDDVALEFSGNRLLVDAGGGPRLGLFLRTPSFRVSVRAPHESRLELASVSADVRADGRFGFVEAKTVSGDLSVGDVLEDAEVKTVSGDVKLRHVAGHVAVNTVSGDVKIAEAVRGVDAKTVSGDQSIDSVTEGQTQLQSVSGDIRVGIQQGSGVWFDLRSASGKTVSELEPADGPAGDGPSIELRAKAVSGDIRIVRAA